MDEAIAVWARRAGWEEVQSSAAVYSLTAVPGAILAPGV